MFVNVGAKLKKFIRVYRTVCLIFYAIACIVGGIALAMGGMEVGLLLAPIVFLVCYILTWLSTALIYAFAEMAENVQRLTDTLAQPETSFADRLSKIN